MPIIPVAISDHFKSSKAERAVLDRFINSEFSASDNKYIFHSIRAQETDRKLVGEIDFIYLDNECILFLEVKGGQVFFTESTRDWHVMGGNKKQDPWKQVADYLFHLRDKLFPKVFREDYFNQKLIFGYGVLFPDCTTPSKFTEPYQKERNNRLYEYDLQLVYDAKDHSNRETGIDDYISRLKNYWSRHSSNSQRKGVGINDLKRIKSYFSQDIVFDLPISAVLKDDESRTKYFTDEQGRMLDMCMTNLGASFIVKGGPGTGKTVLAMDLALKLLQKGNTVLFVVYNQPLRAFLNFEKSRLTESEKISKEHSGNFKIQSFNQLMIRELKKNKIKFDHSSEAYEKLSEVFMSRISQESIHKYDYLIVDECQDIANAQSFSVLNTFIQGGFDSKNFLLFMDDRFQVLYPKNYDQDFLESFINSTSTFKINLERNCRNSENIVNEASLNTGLPLVDCMKGNIFEPQLIYYEDESHMMDCIKEILSKIKNAQVKNRLIGIITDSLKIRDNILELIPETNKLDNDYFKHGIDKVGVDTDRRYKGIDNELMIYIGSSLFDETDEAYLCRLYVAITRAKGRLYLLFPKSIMKKLISFRMKNTIEIFKY